jgi:hypothetical protein
VWSVSRDDPGLPGAELALLVADAKGDRASKDDAELLVLMAVLGGDSAWLELDHSQRESIAVQATRSEALPDLLRRDRGEVVEGAQRGRPRRKM